MTDPHEPTVAELFDLTSKTALVTGGTGHLGGALCRALAEAGASVIVTSRDADRAQATASTLPRIVRLIHTGFQRRPPGTCSVRRRPARER